MSFKVVIDSCDELTDEMKASGCFETAFSYDTGRRSQYCR